MNAVIIVPLDGSPLAEQALPVAAKLAHGLDMELLLVHVIDPMAARITLHGTHSRTIEDERHQMQLSATRYLMNRQAAWRKAGITSSVEVREGSVGATIVALATQRQAAYVVMGTHAKTGLARVALGSVVDVVMREYPCPVVLVPPRNENTLVHLAPLRNILLPLDGSLFAEAALPHAKVLASAFNAPLQLLRVTTVIPAPAHHLDHFPRGTVRVDSDRAVTEQYLARVQSKLIVGGYRVDSHLGVGHAGNVINERANAIPADLIVMTTHARTGIARTVLGSTADHVVRGGQCPVLLIRPE